MKMNGNPYDVVIIGGGHNGLVCAAYLAMAGKKVMVLERRSVVGGAAVTEEFHPGFRNSVASYTVSLLNPKVIADLELHRHGLEVLERKVNNFWPQPDGGVLAFHTRMSETKKDFAKYSKKDAEALPRYYADIEKGAEVLRSLLLETPPNVGGGFKAFLKAAKIGNRMRKLPLEDEQLVLDFFTKSASEFLDSYFESEAVKGAFAFDSIVGFYGSPHTPGSAYVLLHHAFGEVNGKPGVWGHAVGGMGAITRAMAAAATEAGAEISTDSPVRRVVIEKGRVSGVELEGGEVIAAKAVAANVGPRLLFTKMVAGAALPAAFYRRMQKFACGSGVFRMNVALDGLPDFPCLKGLKNKPDYMTGGIVMGPDIAYLNRAYTDALEDGWSRAPIVEMLVPSTLDDTLAPKGKHVASLFCQQFAYDLPGGKTWPEAREEAADLIIDTVDKYAPGFKKLVLGRQVLSPWDLEQKFGLVRGDIFHGRLTLDQMFSSRPALGYADYRTPIKGLYLCGAGAHPGGGVTGAPGHNAAREILRDL